MNLKFLNKIPFRILYVFFLSVLAFGLSTGEILMSIPSIALAAVWLLERNFKVKWNRIVELKYAPLAFLLIYLVHILWLIGTQSIYEGLNDLVLKLPLLCFPLVIGSIPKLKALEWKLVVGSFLAGVTFASLAGLYLYNTQEIENHRQLSIFISHIRLSLMLGLALFIIGWILVTRKEKFRYLFLIPLVIILIFIRLLESGTGYAMLLLMLGVFTFFLISRLNNKWLKMFFLLSLVGVVLGSTWYVRSIYKDLTLVKDTNSLTQLPYQSANGELYMHDTNEVWLENGNYLWINIAPNELKQTWNEVSVIPIDSRDKKGQKIQATLLRYLTSKGDRKDREAVLNLSNKDIENVENGITSILPPKTGFTARFEEVVYECINLKLDHNPNGHSVIQRIHYLEAGAEIFSRNKWMGIGTGDEKIVYDVYYNEIDSRLDPKNRLRAHNQILSFLVCFGILGSLILAFALIYPVVVLKLNWIFVAALLTILVGLLTDDTLDTQAGVSLVSFAYCFFLFHPIPVED
ncbi:MAG: hypothetical protein ACI8Q1_001702 [Parvicella sp.]